MTNPLKGEVPLTLADGRELLLVLDFHALVVAERAYGKPMPEMLADALRGFVGATTAILFGALQSRQPTVTQGEAEALFASDGEAVQRALDAASDAAFPPAPGKAGDTAEDRKAGNAAARARAGKSSGASGAKAGSSRTRSGAPRPKPSS